LPAGKRANARLCVPIGVALACAVLASCGGETLDAPWEAQLGSEAADSSFGVAAAADGDMIITAATAGSLAGDHAGKRDILLARYSPEGVDRWSVQVGGEANDSPLGVSAAPDGSIYVGGFTDGSFAGDHAGSADVWIARFESDGTELWRRQFGGDGWDRGFDVTAFDGGAYITGYTASILDAATNHEGFDGFAARFDDTGTMEWVRQFGTDSTDWGQGSSLVPDGGLYVTGYTEGDMAGPNRGDKDAFVLRLSPGGDEVWARQFGTAALDWPQGVGTTDDGGVIVAGSTEGDLDGANAGERDAFVAAFDENGEPRFTTQFGETATDSVFEVRATENGYIATGSTAAEATSARSGERDGLLAWFDADGALTAIDSTVVDGGIVDLTGLDVSDDGVVFYSGTRPGPVDGDTDIVLGATDGPVDG